MTKQISITRLLAASAIASVTVAFSACDVKKTEEGEMPKVNVEGGNMPKYDVDAPDVKMESKQKTITVPDVDIVTPDEKKAGGNVEAGDTGALAPSTAPAPAADAAPAPAPAAPVTPPAP